MPIALTPNEKWDYVLEDERKLDPAKQTMFKLKTFDGKERGAYIASGFSSIMALSFGLVGWEKFRDAQGQAVPFLKDQEGRFDVENLGRLTEGQIGELAHEIRVHGQLTEDERKNLLSPVA
jgi:hypothetical protein